MLLTNCKELEFTVEVAVVVLVELALELADDELLEVVELDDVDVVVVVVLDFGATET